MIRTNSRTGFRFKFSGLAIALAVALPAPCRAEPEPEPAPVETVPAQPEAVLETITVTARKVEEASQDVPLPVTVRSEQDLVEAAVSELSELGTVAPNLYITETTAQTAAPLIQMRGQLTNDVVATVDPSIGFYVDGVYVARPAGANLSFLDVKSVQVLRGPQGTLFGRNTTGGAILLSTRDPEFDARSGSLMLGGGSYGQHRAQAVFNLPLIDKRLALRVAAQRNWDDGFGFDASNDRDIGTDENQSLRVKLLYTPREDLRLALSGEFQEIDQLGLPAKAVFATPTRFADTDGDGIPDTPFAGLGRLSIAAGSGGMDDYDNYLGGDANRVNYDPGLVPRNRVTVESTALTTTWERGAATWKLIAGYRNTRDNLNRVDFDGTPYTILETTLGGSVQQTSFELQGTGRLLADDALRWVLGSYWFAEDGDDFTLSNVLVGLNPANPTRTLGEVENRSRGVYAQGTLKLVESWSVSAGIRHSIDDKDLVSRNSSGSGAFFNCEVPVERRASPDDCRGRFDRDFSKTNYLVGSDWRISPEVLLFGSVTTGYRSGGQNLRGISENSFVSFEPEEVTQYEIGAKTDWFDRRLRINAAIFAADYRDIQRTVTVVATNARATAVVRNAGRGRVLGGELELDAALPCAIELGASLGVIQADYEVFDDPVVGDRSAESFPNVPELSYSLSAARTWRLPKSRVRASLHWSWNDDVQSPAASIAAFRATSGVDISRFAIQDAVGVLAARVQLDLASGLEVGVWGRNLTDEARHAGSIAFDDPIGMVTQFRLPGREAGVDVMFRF
ncbi:MAG: TonB-dependent receptor [Panacagrimonas sp.]